MRNRKYQTYAHVLVCGDGFVRAKNKKEAVEKTKEYLMNEMAGVSVLGVEVTDVITEKSRFFDEANFPSDEDFDDRDYVTYQFLN